MALRPTPMRRGAMQAVALVVFLVAAVTVLLVSLDLHPPAALLGRLSDVGAVILVAYAVEATWLVQVSAYRGPDREEWIGFACGLAVCGLLGIAVALCGSGRQVVHPNLLDRLALAWPAASLGMLGVLVAFQPLMIYDWKGVGATD